MNKLLKGSIAGAAGIALLLGGAGTLAVWNDSNTFAAGSITAGNLDIAPTSAATDGWKNGATSITNLGAYTIVPGDTLSYSKTFTVTATGDNLTATAGLTGGAITAASTGAADVALAALLSKSASFTVDGVTTATINASTGTKTVVVTVSITFPSAAPVTDNAAKLGSVNLADFNIAVTQTITP